MEDWSGAADAETDAQIEALAQSRGLLIVRDDAAMEKWIDQVIAANPKPVEDYTGGKVSAAGRLVGEVMKATRGRANPGVVKDVLFARLDAL